MRIDFPSQVTKAEILAALSHALDLVEGQPEGHASRTSLIAQRVADVLGLQESQKNSLFFAALLKDAGCSNNSARIHKLFGGDDFLVKHGVKLIDWSNPVESLRYAWINTERDGSVVAKLRRMLTDVGSPKQVMDGVTHARCTRGAEIALMLGFDSETASAVRDLDEHWDGKGAPRHLKGDAIPLLARILCVSQTLEVFVTAFGINEAYEMLSRRAGSWFDRDIATACLSFRNDAAFWNDHATRAQDATLDLEIPAVAQIAEQADIDRICEAFALIVDAKSSFTAEHSTRVTQHALDIADVFGLSPERRTTLRRSALLHDVGKLGVSNAILEKPGKPTDDEFEAIRRHPKFTYDILRPITGFARIADIAAAHHERLDGRGYWRGLRAEELDLDMRILAVADVFDALSAERPYRGALPMDQVFAILAEEARTGLDPDCVRALREIHMGEARAA